MCCPLFILRMNSTAGCFSHFLKNLWSQWRHSSLRWVLFEHLSVFSPQSFLKHSKTFHKLFPEISEAETLTQSECSFRSTVCYSFADIDYGDDITHCGPFFLIFCLIKCCILLLCPAGKNSIFGLGAAGLCWFFFQQGGLQELKHVRVKLFFLFLENHLTTSNDPCCVCVCLCVSVCVAAFTCALQKEVLYHGKLFVSEHHVCFHSSVLLKETKVTRSDCWSAHSHRWH